MLTKRTQTWLERVAYILHRGLSRLGPRISFRVYYLVAQPVLEKPLLPTRHGRDIVVRRIERGDPVLNEFPRLTEEIEMRFDADGVCFAAFKRGALTGYIWFIPGPYREPEDRCVYIPMPADIAVWDLDVFIKPEERLGFTFIRLWGEGNRYLLEQGYRWALSRISVFNLASLSSHQRLSARRIARMGFLSIGPLQFMWSGVPPRMDVSLGAARMPTVRVYAPEDRA